MGPASGRVLLKSNRIHDGSGGRPFRGGVLVDAGRIAQVQRGDSADAADVDVVDVGDDVLAPGFVDLHTHSDVSVLSEPSCISAIAQGITTQVVGLCGFSAAPVTEDTRVGMVAEEPVFGFPGVDWNWTGLDGYLDTVEASRPATNIASLVGHNTIRRLVMGGAGRPADAPEIAAMSAHIADAAPHVAGFSTGLSYAPGLFADEAELTALVGAAARHGLRHHTHMRYGDTSVRKSLEEAIRVAHAAGAALNISHLYPSPKDAADEAERLLELIDAARSSGTDVTFDLTVFPRGGGAWVQSLPAWARVGGAAGTLERIADDEGRALLIEHLDALHLDWDDALIVKVTHTGNAHLVGCTIAELARERGEPPAATALHLVVEDSQFWVAPHVKRQADLDVLITHPTCVPITDGMAAHPVTHRDLGVMPKTFGSMPLVLGSYVRERKILRLEQAVEKLTRLPAERAGITDRGRLSPGWAADLVVFDADLIANTANDADPTSLPIGVRHVLVNGRWAMRDGALTHDRAGQVLHSPTRH